MVIKIDYSKCDSCLQCLEACPVNAIVKKEKIALDSTRCINCRTCLVSCPLKAIYIK